MAEAVKALTNSCGFSRDDYKGASKSTMCAGCGHDGITNHIVSAMYQANVSPYDMIKVSGIGCSSKTPAYFGKQSFAFNSVHGRMPSIATGAKVVNPDLHVLGLSGDGDTASIGIGQFCHVVRRNLDMVYIIANNGVYGLTKGQFSATADEGSKLKSGEINEFSPIDSCRVAIELGCPYVVRSFSGDKKQLVPLIEGAFSFRGCTLLDILSPCVTFNNHPGSTKSYSYVKEHDIELQEIGYIPPTAQVEVDYKDDKITEIKLHDGSLLTLKKINREDYDPTDKIAALQALDEAQKEGIWLTGLLYYNEDKPDFNHSLQLNEKKLVDMNEADLRPSEADLQKIMKDFG